MRVRGNSLYFAGGDATGVLVGEEGEGYEVLGNAIAHVGPGRLLCYQVDSSKARYTAIDRNTCHHERSSKATWIRDGNRRLDLARWRSRSGFDEHSAFRDPEFVPDRFALKKRATEIP